MLMQLLYRCLMIIFCTMGPAYKTFKALKNRDHMGQIKLMMHWNVFACFLASESVLDIFLFWLPFYYELKTLFLLYLSLPISDGGVMLYRKYLHPKLIVNEEEIDQFIEQIKNDGYQTLEKMTAVMFDYGSCFITNLYTQIINKKAQFQTFSQMIEASKQNVEMPTESFMTKNEAESEITLKSQNPTELPLD